MESSQLEIKNYISLILKKKHLFVIAAVSIITAFVTGSYFLPKVYEAESSVIIEKNVINNFVEGIAITPSMEERLRNLSFAMKSRDHLLKVIKDLDLDVDMKDQTEIEDLIGNFQKNTNIKTSSKKRRGEMDMFIVSYRGSNPLLVRDYVNTLVRRYIEENLSAKREEAYGANRFLSEQIGFFKDKIDKVDKKIIDFRKEKGIFIAIDERGIVEKIKDAQEELEKLKIQGMELKAKRSSIKRQIKEENPYTLNNRLIMLQNRLNELLINYTENYPEVLKVKAEIESLKAGISNRPEDVEEPENTETEMSTLNPVHLQLKEELSSIGLELAAMSAKEKHLKNLIETKKAYLRDIPAEKTKLADLEREKDTNKNIYEQLILRLGQSEVSKQIEVQDKNSTFRIIDPAILPTKPVSPDMVKLILMAIFAGLAGGFGFVMLLDYMDSSVKSVGALKTLNIPVLAIIPAIKTEEELSEKRKKDILLYALTGVYMLCILGVFAMELVG